MTTPATQVLYTAPATGAVERPLDTWLSEVLSLKDFGAIGDGVANDTAAVTAAIVAAFTSGKKLRVPDGVYRITSEINVIVTRALHIECSPRARFVADNINGDLFFFQSSPSAASYPDNPLSVVWRGGIIDTSGQKTSTVVPFISNFPPANPGTAGTCDGLAINGSAANFDHVEVSGVEFYAGTHWQSAGGDSSLYVNGCRSATIEGNVFRGSRDLGVYLSGYVSTGTNVERRYSVRDNTFIDCMYCVSVKRSVIGFNVNDNTAINCVQFFGGGTIHGNGNKGGAVYSNTCKNVTRMVYLDSCEGVSEFNNVSLDAGATATVDGQITAVGIGYFSGVYMQACTNCSSFGSKAIGIHPSWAAAADRYFVKCVLPESGTTKVTNCDVTNASVTAQWQGVIDEGGDATAAGNRFFMCRGQTVNKASTSVHIGFEGNNGGGSAQNALVFRDADGSTVAGQPMGRIEWRSADANMPGAASYIEARSVTVNGGSRLHFGTAPIGSSAADNFTIAEQGNNYTPATSGELAIEATSNTTLTIKYKGSDGVVRSGTVALA